jgi:hypothetical protein
MVITVVSIAVLIGYHSVCELWCVPDGTKPITVFLYTDYPVTVSSTGYLTHCGTHTTVTFKELTQQSITRHDIHDLTHCSTYVMKLSHNLSLVLYSCSHSHSPSPTPSNLITCT